MQRILLTPETLDTALAQAAEVLRGGGLVLYPTETVYGVGVDAMNSDAVTTLLRYKNRPAGKAISVLVASAEQAEGLVELNDSARHLYRTFLPGPVTVISRSLHKVDPRLESELGTLGIRMSSHPVAMGLSKLYGGPITATSANASGRAAPYTPDQALDSLSTTQRALVGLILDAGTLPHNKPSTVVDTTQAVQEVIRGGDLLADPHPAWVTRSAEETEAVGLELVKSLRYLLADSPIVLALEGPLGAGKTQFAHGVAQALGVTATVSSPTYVLIKEYEGKVADESYVLIHMDCWRLENPTPEDLELQSYFKAGSVVVIEWAGALLPYLAGLGEKIIGYHLHFNPLDESTREIRIRKL